MMLARLRLLVSLAWSSLAAQPGRSLVAVLAIAVGVALGYAIHLINHSAVREFSRAVGSLTGQADISVRGDLPDALYARLAKDPDVAMASPVLEIRANLPGRREPLLLMGVDPFRVAGVAPQWVGQSVGKAGGGAGLDLLSPDAVFLSPAAQQWLGLHAGDRLPVLVGLQTVQLKVAGSLSSAGAGQRIGVMDIAGAQWRLRQLGMLNRIDLKLRPGVDEASFMQRWTAHLPAGARFDSAASSERRASNVSRAYRVNLTVLGLVALFTGAFLVFSSQVLSVLRRRGQLALLRVLGMTRRGLSLLVLLEAAALGSLGSAVGVAGGILIADTALKLLGGDLGGGYFNGVTPALHVEPFALTGFFLLGLFTAVAGSVAPAIEVARAKPSTALKAGDEEAALSRLRSPWPGLVLFAIAALLLRVGPVGELPLPGYLAVACLLVGALWLMPWFTARLLGWVPSAWQRSPVGGVALTQLKEAPGYAGIGLAGILASFSLMVAMVIMVASFRVSLTDWLDHLLPADLYVRSNAGGDTSYFSAGDLAAIQAAPGVGKAEFLRTRLLSLDPARPEVTLIARSLAPAEAATRLPIVGMTVPVPAGAVPVWVSEAMVDLYHAGPGQALSLPLPSGRVQVVVAGVWRDYARQHGAVTMTLADYRRLTGDATVTDAALWLRPGARGGDVQQQLRHALPSAALQFAEPGEIRRVSLDIFDRSFAVTYLLEAVAVIVGLMGIGVSFGGQALARLREFGMLRHLGYRKRDIDRLLALEGLVLASIGVLAGLAVGWLISRILIDVINPQSFHWTMQTHIPWTTLLMVSALLIALSAGTAVLAGRRALSVGAVRAVKEDW